MTRTDILFLTFLLLSFAVLSAHFYENILEVTAPRESVGAANPLPAAGTETDGSREEKTLLELKRQGLKPHPAQYWKTLEP